MQVEVDNSQREQRRSSFVHRPDSSSSAGEGEKRCCGRGKMIYAWLKCFGQLCDLEKTTNQSNLA